MHLRRIAASALIILGSVSLIAAPAQAHNDHPAHKVWVCKYVGTPGVNERLKDGKQPISVDSDATVGSYFNDAQGRSYVLAVDDGSPAPDASQCPAPDGGTTTTVEDTTTTLPEVTTTTAAPEVTTTTVADPTTTTIFEAPTTVPDVHKVWVCKYVGTPGVDERLKEGKQQISVDASSTDGTGVGGYFNDAQGRSFVLAIDDGETVYTAADCPDHAPDTTTTTQPEVTTTTAPEVTTTTVAPTTTVPVTEPPTTLPPTTIPPKKPATTTTTAAVVPPTSGPTGPAPAAPTNLPFTGSNPWGLAGFGLVALLSGLGLLARSRRVSQV